MNELIANPTKAIGVFAAIAGAIILIASVIRNDRRIRSQWARRATLLAAACVLIWCAGTLWLLLRSASIPPNIASATMLLKTAIGSMGAGILITLFISRSFAWRCPPEPGEGR